MWVGGWVGKQRVCSNACLFVLGWDRAPYIYICAGVPHPLVSVLPLVVARCGYVLSIHLAIHPSIHLSIDR